jgi:PAS domain S-box-containing protein
MPAMPMVQNRLAKLPVELLSAVVDALPVGALIMDAEWRVLAVNQAGQRFFGFSEEELRTLSVDDLVPPELRERYRLRRTAALLQPREGVLLRDERIVRTKDGRDIPLDVTIARVRAGDSYFLLSTLIDASPHTDAERQTIEQLQSILEHAEQGIFLVRVALDGTFTFESFNPVTERLTGFSSEQARGRTPEQIVPVEEAARVAACYRRCVETGAAITYEEAPGAAAGFRVFRTTLVPIRDRSGRVQRILGLSRDITDQKQAESELERTRRTLAESEGRFRAAFRVSPHPIGITEFESGRLIEMNEAFVRTFGHSREEAIGKTTVELGLWRNPADRMRMLESLQQDGRMQDLEVEGTTKTGERLEASLSADMAVLDGVPCIITYVLDLTSRRVAERAKAELEDQLRHAQKMDALGTLAGGIAHDFNNILAAIVAYSELIRLDIADPSTVENHLTQLKLASDRARDLVGQILTFSRQQPRIRTPTRIDSAVREALNLLRSTLPKTIAIEASLDDGAPLVLADATEIHQIIMNLGTNAAHAIAPNAGRISIQLEAVRVDAAMAEASTDLQARRYARLRVRDDGAGIGADVLEHLFEPFFTTKAAGKGTGLGLSVVHGIVTEHDGAIRVKSEIGAGTEFEVYFPECSPEVVADPEPEPLSLNVAGVSILFVDDEVILCRSVSRLLERVGFSVVAQSDPAAAVALFRSDPQRFDVVLTDLNMPGMTGLDVAREIHAIDPQKPILVMSGFQGSYTAESLRSVGVSDLVPKPLSTEQLLDCLKRALRRNLLPRRG